MFTVTNLVILVVGLVVGFFASRANGDGTKLDAIADKVDLKWDAKVKPILKDLKTEVEELKKKLEAKEHKL